ncbi:MAG: zinc ribbon domain-containing protein [Clostridiales bacterium]|nr:zinc ribbon domain-containing protein [Clostridiales bacterium]
MNKMKNCKVCGAEIAANAKVCPSCGAINKPPIYKRVWFWLFIVFIVLPAIGLSFSSGGDENATDETTATVTASSSTNTGTTTSEDDATSSVNPAFAGDCGISSSGQMGSSIIDYPELTISITNTTEKEISAIKFYAVPYDVYGDEIVKWSSQNNLYTDTSIAAGSSTSIYYQFIEDSVKTIKLYVYSVYFSDGTEWGDKDATESTILENGVPIEVSGES